MKPSITQAMILAAGFGTRLRPITDTVPKAMVPVRGKPLLDYALDHLERAGVGDCVVNTHYLADVINRHLQSRKHPKIFLSHENEILETGGGILMALPRFHGKEFFAINADSLWRDRDVPLLRQLSDVWDPSRMDALLAILPNTGQYPELSGDFAAESDGRLNRGSGFVKPFIYIGVQILHPRLFAECRPGKFSLSVLYDRAIAGGRLFGHVAQSVDWFHISKPRDLAKTEQIFSSGKSDEGL